MFEIPIIALLALLLTTPADAVRLSPRRSTVFVVGGTLLNQIGVLIATPIRGGPHVTRVSILICLITSADTILLQYGRRSPWWVVVIAWNPLLLAAQLLR